MEIKNSTIVISGGASGLGEASTRHLVSLGAKVVILDINDKNGKNLEDELGQENARFQNCDIRNEDSIKSALAFGFETFGPLRALVNCAGIGGAMKTAGSRGAHDIDAFRGIIEVNLVGVFNLIRLFAQHCIENSPLIDEERAVMISTASVAAFDGQIGQVAYSASKGGIVGMTLPIARDLSRSQIRNLTIAPGLFETPMLASTSKEVYDSLVESTLNPKRLGKPHEYALLVEHIIRNPMLNGETIRLDGGIRLAPK